MKKIILTMGLLTFLTTPALATCDYPTKCATYTPNIMAKTGQFLSNATGSTFVGEKIAQGIIERELKKATGQDFKAEIKSFSLADLIDGKFKSLTISGNNVTVEGIHFSAIKINTLCDFNHIDVHSHPLKFNENVVLAFSMEFSGEDIKNAAQNPKYLDKLNKANLTELGIRSYKIYPESINIENNKLCCTINAQPTGPYKSMDIGLNADLKIENEKLTTSKINMINLYSGFDLTELSNLPKIIKNLNFSFTLFGNKNTEVQIQNESISDGKLTVQGMVFIPKTSEQPQLQTQSTQLPQPTKPTPPAMTSQPTQQTQQFSPENQVHRAIEGDHYSHANRP